MDNGLGNKTDGMEQLIVRKMANVKIVMREKEMIIGAMETVMNTGIGVGKMMTEANNPNHAQGTTIVRIAISTKMNTNASLMISIQCARQMILILKSVGIISMMMITGSNVMKKV